MRGATSGGGCTGAVLPISTHAPLAGRDQHHTLVGCSARNFNPRAPCGARRICLAVYAAKIRISTHAPLAGRDLRRRDRSAAGTGISTHAPLAGRDKMGYKYTRVGEDFNPRAPCGARLSIASITSSGSLISTHAPLAGRDYAYILHDMDTDISTHAPLAGRDCRGRAEGHLRQISTHAPLAGRDRLKPRQVTYQDKHFNPRAPCGARRLVKSCLLSRSDFNPRAPCGARHSFGFGQSDCTRISTHAPLAGRDLIPWLTLLCHRLFQPTRPLRGAT